MVQKYKIPAIVFVVVVFLAAYFYTQVDWEERAIRKRLNELVELVEKDGPVSTFEAAGRSRKVVEFFEKNPSIEYAPGRRLPKDLDSISGAFLSVWGQVETASLRISHHEVDIQGVRAESNITARCSVVLRGSERMGDALDYKITWIRQEGGEWVIQGVVAFDPR